MKFIPYEVLTGQQNMDIDNKILETAIQTQTKEPIFRFYGWKPKCISLGRNQKDSFLDNELLKVENIDIVRRLTGGRALLHDKEITYSYVCSVESLKNGQNVIKSYMEISQILIDAFKKLDIELNFGGNSNEIHTKFDYCMLISTGADLTYNGKKLIGSAQCRKENYILQHGSILYDYDKDLLEKIFNERINHSQITSIKEINPDITINDILHAFNI